MSENPETPPKKQRFGRPPVTDRVPVQALMRETGSHRENIRIWLEAEGYDCANLEPALRPRYLEIIRSHQNSANTSRKQRKPGEDGMTWLEKKQREEARKLKRENEIAERALAEEWIAAPVHHQILANVTSKLEGVPDKAKAELGLSAIQHDRLQKILDEIRFDAAAATQQAFEDGKKKAAEEKV